MSRYFLRNYLNLNVERDEDVIFNSMPHGIETSLILGVAAFPILCNISWVLTSSGCSQDGGIPNSQAVILAFK